VQQQPPLYVGDDDQSDIDDEDGPARWTAHQLEAQHRLQAEAHDFLIGARYQHPDTKRIYEIFNIFWHKPTNQLAAYRRATDGLPPDQDDVLPFAVEGDHGILALVRVYEEEADAASGLKWPTNEEEMLQLQQQDQQLNEIWTELRDKRKKDQECP
jgi:hypothetical protein